LKTPPRHFYPSRGQLTEYPQGALKRTPLEGVLKRVPAYFPFTGVRKLFLYPKGCLDLKNSYDIIFFEGIFNPGYLNSILDCLDE
jgi:hypothetical protein